MQILDCCDVNNGGKACLLANSRLGNLHFKFEPNGDKFNLTHITVPNGFNFRPFYERLISHQFIFSYPIFVNTIHYSMTYHENIIFVQPL